VSSHGREFFLRAITPVRVTSFDELREHFTVSIHSLRLIERTFVGIEAKPVHAVENDLRRFVSRTFAIRILDAQDESTCVTASIKP
jgi:hypothetical protein